MLTSKPQLKFMLVAGLILALASVAIAYGVVRYLADKQFEQAQQRFMLLNSLRKQALTDYFRTAEAELTFWSLNEELTARQVELVALWRKTVAQQGDPGARLRKLYIESNPHHAGVRHQLADAGDGSAYSALHARLHPLAKKFVTERGYYDLFLISPDGDIIYTVEKESDFGSNLKTGAWKQTGLADVYRRALAAPPENGTVTSDLVAYAPSAGAPAMFMARAMRNADGELVGVLAFQLPIDRIGSIMQFTAGMGDSGETYLVGEDYLMRSDSRFSRQSTVLQTAVETGAVKRALAGEQGVMMMPDYRGVPVLSAYDSVEIDGFRWAILAEIDRDEVLQGAAESQTQVAGLMAVFYALAMGSLLFMRPDESAVNETAGEFPVSDADDFPELPG
jgi:methyl-accepting chemotaxis protein